MLAPSRIQLYSNPTTTSLQLRLSHEVLGAKFYGLGLDLEHAVPEYTTDKVVVVQ